MIKILVPLDGSSVAEEALNHAVLIARTFSSELILLRVISGDNTDATVRADAVDLTLWRYQASAYLKGLLEKFSSPDLQVRCEVVEGSIAETIIRYMKSEKIDIVVLTRYGRGNATDFAAGGTAQKIVAGANCSVLLLDPHELTDPHKNYKRILVPIDDSKNSDCAVAIAVIMAETHGASLVLLHVTREQSLASGARATLSAKSATREIQKILEFEATRRLDELASTIPGHIEVEKLILTSADEAFAIESIAYEVNSDLLLLHTVEAANNHGQQYGSIIQLLIQYSHRPLFILRPAIGEGVASHFRSVYLDQSNTEAG